MLRMSSSRMLAPASKISPQEVRRLARRGTPVVVFQPSASDQEVMGDRALAAERNAAVVRAARETTLRRLERGRHADRLAVLAA